MALPHSADQKIVRAILSDKINLLKTKAEKRLFGASFTLDLNNLAWFDKR
jgi:hypothetical protein